jgi:transcriptional regulator with XRE-family HTH domain
MEKALYLKEVLKEKGIKQTYIAEKLGLSNSAISLWVKGKAHPNLANLKKLAEILAVDVTLLINGKQEWHG